MGQMVECSGKGLCDRKTGECECFGGFTGEGCRRSACPNDCSGHGICQSLEKFARDYVPAETVNDVTAEYDTAWDSKYSFGCKCDDGYRGPDCSLKECPSTSDVLGGHGNERGRTAVEEGSVIIPPVLARASRVTMAPSARFRLPLFNFKALPIHYWEKNIIYREETKNLNKKKISVLD